jgi:IPT/TIG domain
VTITGANLRDVTEVLFGKAPAMRFTVKSATVITAVSPAATEPGLVPISVYDSQHRGSSGTDCYTNPLCGDGFTYLPQADTPPPTLSAPFALPVLRSALERDSELLR